MLIRLKGGRIVDPVHKQDGIGDVFIEDGRIVALAEVASPTRLMTSRARSSWHGPSTSAPISRDGVPAAAR
jgi:predicted amidohydrolase